MQQSNGQRDVFSLLHIHRGMTSIRKLELGGGVATALPGLILPFRVNGMHTIDLFRLYPELLADALVLSIFPGLLVALGAYAHAAKQRSWGVCCFGPRESSM
jgi:hypothetical protein